MAEKDFNAMLHNSKDMPKVKTITDEKTIARYGGSHMLIAPPIEYDALLRRVPRGRLAAVADMRALLAKRHGADFTCPLTAGIFISLVAQASRQRPGDETPWWRALKKDGELNAKYPGGLDEQQKRLEAEGHTVVRRGKRRFVKDYEQSLYRFAEE